MGGDHGCGVVVEGAVAALREFGISSILVGDEAEITPHLHRLGLTGSSAITVRHAPDVITMDDSPGKALRAKPQASIRVALELVSSGEACAVVSPGNTGAVMAASVFVSGLLPGIARPAIASLIPRVGDLPPTVLLDSGANIDCRADQLVQFALMGSCYAASLTSPRVPRVALLSNGSEPSKGNDITRAAALSLSRIPDLSFVGYVEGRDIPRDAADVVVCDGFVGNIVLKCMEGSVELVFDLIRRCAEMSLRGKIGLALARPVLKRLFRERLDPSAYGGAPLLGLNHVVIICHGSARERAIMNGVRVARRFVEQGLGDQLRAALGRVESEAGGPWEDGMWDRLGDRFEKRPRLRAAGREVEKERKE